VSQSDYYDEIAKGYVELHGEEQLKKISLIKEHLKVEKTDELLDIGCGPGFIDFDCDITGIDPSEKLLEKAKFKTVLGFAEDLPFDDDSFDIVISITALQNFRDVNKALDEAARVGKRDFVFTFLKKSVKAAKIEELIEKKFKVTKRIEQDKDIILFAAKNI